MGDIGAIRARAELVEPKADGFIGDEFYRWARDAADDRDELLDRLSAAEARTRELEATVQRVRDYVDRGFHGTYWGREMCHTEPIRAALRGSDD